MGWFARAGVGLASVAILVTWFPVQTLAASSVAGAASIPSAHRTKGVCLVFGAPSVVPGTSALVIAPHPVGVAVTWLPGLNASNCSTTTTHAGATVARALARDISRSSSVSSRVEFNCPMDDAAGAMVSFADAHHRTAAPIVIGLSGCRFVSASGKLRRSTTTSLSTKLATLAPCGWKAYFNDGSGAC